MKTNKIEIVAEYRTKGIIDFCDMRESCRFYTDSENFTDNIMKALKKYFAFSFKKDTEMFISVFFIDHEKTERAYCVFTDWQTLSFGTIKYCICQDHGYCDTDHATTFSPAILYKKLASIFDAQATN